MLLEVEGRTHKLVSDDYIAAAEGDLVRALCEPIKPQQTRLSAGARSL